MPLAGCPIIEEKTPETRSDAEIDGIGDTTPDSIGDSGDSTTDVPLETEIDTGPVGCQPLELTGELEANEVEGVFTLGGEVDLGLGGPLPDAMIFEFYSEATGTFDLATGGNENYKSCSQCVRFVQDIDESGGKPAKNFFQKSGRMTIDEDTPPSGTKLSVTLSALEMIEVTIRGGDYETTPVENGQCYSREAPLLLETGQCVPACGDHVCGPDGCGGQCGEPCAQGHCRLDGSMCETAPQCVKLGVSGMLSNTAPGVFRIDVTGHGLGAVAQSDFLQIEFYKNETGTFDLSTPANHNYSTCDQCVRLVLDGKVELFQRQGSLLVNDVSVPIGDPETDGYADLHMSGVVLEEVAIDDQFNSRPIPGGACVQIDDGRITSTPP